jgi:hypothetical protein
MVASDPVLGGAGDTVAGTGAEFCSVNKLAESCGECVTLPSSFIR